MKKKRIALISEAGNGLGKVFATILHRQGFEVFLAAKGKSHQELERTDLQEIQLLYVDFTDTDSVERLRTYLEKSHGKLDVLVNNAEIANGFGQKIDEIRLEDVKAIFNENFYSVINSIQMLNPLLRHSDKARIINISSSLGNISKMADDEFCYSDYQMIAYSSAKAALEMLTVLLKKEFKGSPIKVINFDPIRIKNCTHNSVAICQKVEEAFLEHLGIPNHQVSKASLAT